jgi:hypothetical protein
MYIYDNNGQVQKIQTQEHFIQPQQEPQRQEPQQACQENFTHPHSKENYITTVIRENFEHSSSEGMILWSLVGLVIVAIIAGGGWYFYTHNKKGSSSSKSGSSESSGMASDSSSSAPEMAEPAMNAGFRFY